MDKLTQDFFNADFPGWKSSVEIADNPFYTDVPIVEIETDINCDYINLLAKQINSLDRADMQDQQPPYQIEPRSQGLRISDLLWNYGNRPTSVKNWRTNEFVEPAPIIKPGSAESLIEQHLKSRGFDLKICMHMSLEPNGYLRPHRDISDNWPLLYVWIPLTYPLGSELKFYPLGTVTPKLGNVYLFNQNSYTHSIRNTNATEIRYALIGHLDENLMNTKEFRQIVVDSINKQYNS